MKLLENIKHKLLSTELELFDLFTFYRYISVLVISFFYLTNFSDYTDTKYLYLKFIAIVCLFLEAYVFTKFYKMNNDMRYRRILISVEALTLTFVYLFTGASEGVLGTAFLWYIINPMLIAVIVRPFYFCWGILIVIIGIIIFWYVFLQGKHYLFLYLHGHYVFIITFVFIILIAQLLYYFIESISRQNELVKKQLDDIKTLYEAVELFSIHSNPKEIINLFAAYTKSITEATKVIIWVNMGKNETENTEMYYSVRGPKSALLEEEWYPHVKNAFEEEGSYIKQDVHEIKDKRQNYIGVLIIVKIKSKTRVFGVLAGFYLDDGKKMNILVKKQNLIFLADLCAVALEKTILETMAEKFLLLQEQNRIAGELHDNVTQNIFGIIHGLDALLKNKNLDDLSKRQIEIMQRTAQDSLKDLRSIIYDMSSIKSRKEEFASEIKKYLENLSKLNQIKVEYKCSCNIDSLEVDFKKAIYRIIKEATGNSIRHSGCDYIHVKIYSGDDFLYLKIEDNGCGFDCGFDIDGIKNKSLPNGGLGIINMFEITRKLNGRCDIKSRRGEGTSIFVKLPKRVVS